MVNSFINYFGVEAKIKFSGKLSEDDWAPIGSFVADINGMEWAFDFMDTAQKNKGEFATYCCESLDYEYSEIDYDLAPLIATQITGIKDIYINDDGCDPYPISCEYFKIILEYNKGDCRRHEELIFTPEVSESLRKLNKEWMKGYEEECERLNSKEDK